MIGAALDYPVTLCLPSSASQERKRILAAFGAELLITPGDEGTDGAIRKVHELVASEPRQIFLCRPVQQSRELASALSHHGERNLGANVWPDHAFCGRTRHQRHVRGHYAAIEGTEFRDSLHQPAAGRAVSWTRRLEAHGDRTSSGDLR